MLTRFELHYNIQKGNFFTNKIVFDTHTIYYSENMSAYYFNYAVVSDLRSVSSLMEEIRADFAKINRKPCIYINANQLSELRDLQKHNMQVRFSESCLRFDGEEIKTLHQIVPVDEKNIHDFIEVYKKQENIHTFRLEADYQNGLFKALKNPDFYNIVAYDGKRPVAIASMGQYNGFYMIYSLATDKEYFGKGYSQTVLGACTNKFKELNGKALYVMQQANTGLEKLYIQNGFKKIFTGHILY